MTLSSELKNLALKMEASHSYKMLVSTSKSTLHHDTCHRKFITVRKNLK